MRSEEFLTAFLLGILVGVAFMAFAYQFKKDMITQYLDEHPQEVVQLLNERTSK